MKTKFLSSVLIILLAIFSVTAFSCSDSDPVIGSTYHTVIYDFSENSEKYEMFLSVYILPSSDGRRMNSMSVSCNENGYKWNITKPEQFENGKNIYYGCSRLAFINSENFPEGKYTVKYIDLADQETSVNFRIRHLESMKQKKRPVSALDVQKKRAGTECSEKKVAILDKNGRELFFGNWNDYFTSKDDVEGIFPDAVYYQVIYTTRDNTAVIIMPKKKY